MAQQNMSPDENKKIVQRFMEECWNLGNLNKASELLVDQVRFHDPVFPGLNPGIQNIKNHIEPWLRRHPPSAWMRCCPPFGDRRRWQHSVALDGSITLHLVAA
jgi:hypothetical protein